MLERAHGARPYGYYRKCDNDVSKRMGQDFANGIIDGVKSASIFSAKAVLSVPIGLAGASIDTLKMAGDGIKSLDSVAEAAGLDRREKLAPEEGESAMKTLLRRLWGKE